MEDYLTRLNDAGDGRSGTAFSAPNFSPSPNLPVAHIVGWPKVSGEPRILMFCVPWSVAAFSSDWFRLADIACPSPIASASPKRQAEFFFGRLSAKAALHRFDASQTQVGIGLLREPVWPPMIVGSITHTDGIAGAVVARQTEFHGVGIDIETVVDQTAAAALRGCVISAVELRYLLQFEESLSELVLLTLVFSAKESFFKAVSLVVQRNFDFDAIELTTLDLEAQVMEFRLRYSLCAGWQSGALTRVHFQFISPSFIATLCVW